MNLFHAEINNWKEWGDVFQSIAAFEPLVKFILEKEKLPIRELEHLTPGTNAVFKAGDYVIKLFVPKESGFDGTVDRESELFSVKRASADGINTPKLKAIGFVDDKYHFSYMITEYIKGVEFTNAVINMTDQIKIIFGQRLRAITDKINTPCPDFNGIDVIHSPVRQRRWKPYPESFRKERLNYINSYKYGSKVFTHGDLCGDNILLSEDNEIYIIDFADSVLAPVEYEHALIAVELFDFDPALIKGYFGDCSKEYLADIIFNGLLIHDFGGDIIQLHIGNVKEFNSLDKLRKAILMKLI